MRQSVVMIKTQGGRSLSALSLQPMTVEYQPACGIIDQLKTPGIGAAVLDMRAASQVVRIVVFIADGLFGGTTTASCRLRIVYDGRGEIIERIPGKCFGDHLLALALHRCRQGQLAVVAAGGQAAACVANLMYGGDGGRKAHSPSCRVSPKCSPSAVCNCRDSGLNQDRVS